MTVAHFAYLAALVLFVGCLGVVAALLGLRVGKDRAERRHARLRAPIWRDVMILSTGEPDEVDGASVRLLKADARERAVMLGDAFALVPKLRGSARDRLRDVLRHWGSLDEAVRSTRSRSRVRRCRGHYRLGVLAEPATRDVVLAGLDDRDFAVRRTAMIALGSFPESVVVDHLLSGAAAEPRLRRDFLASIDRIGSAAVPTLRRALTRSLAEGKGGDRRGFLAAEALGLVGAMAAVPTLEEALAGSSVELKIACMHALGQLGAPSSVIALSGPLGNEAKLGLASALEIKGAFLSRPELYDRSLALATEVVQLRPDNPEAHEQLGDTLMSMGRYDDSVAALREAIRLAPDRASAHGSLARAYWLGKGDVDGAIAEFEATLRLNPAAGYMHLQLAMLYTLRGDFEAAEQLSRDAIRLQDQAMSGSTGLIVVGAHSRLGYVHYRQGRHDEAIREYRRELELISVGDHLLRERTSIELQQKLGAAYRNRGDIEQAEVHENEALRLFESRLAAGADEPFTRYYVAALYALRGDAARTQEHLQRPLAELPAFTRWRLPRDPDFDLVRDQLSI